METEMNQAMIKTKSIFSEGDIVKVKYNIDKTESIFTATKQMKQMRMKDEIEITRITWSSHKCPCIYAAGWQWHPDDLIVVRYKNPDKLIVDGQQGSFMFDPKNL